jgi:RNA polymerase sigma factor (sigma-70 family)
MEHPDQKYIHALLTNDATIIEEIYKKFFGKIRWLVLQNNGTSADAADIFQEALLSIFNKSIAQNFTLTCPLDAFLYQVCKNKWLKELSKRQHREGTINDLAEYSNVEEDYFKLMEENKLKDEQKKLFLEKLEALDDSCRQLLQMNWQGKSLAEVAEILGLTYINVRKKKVRCMAKLMMLIKQSSQYNDLKW